MMIGPNSVEPGIVNRAGGIHSFVAGASPAALPDNRVPVPVAPVGQNQAAVNPAVEINVDAMIQQGRDFIVRSTGSGKLFNLVDTIVSRAMPLLESHVPAMVTDSWYKQSLIK